MSFLNELENVLKYGLLTPLGGGEQIDMDLDQKPIRISMRDKKIYSNALQQKYYESLAELSDDVMNALDIAGIIPHLNSENWVGGYTGALSTEETARFNIELAKDGRPTNSNLLMSIYKMPSGKYELTSYIT